MELTVRQVAERTGITARMLRHYDAIGLYRPARIAQNGYRWYDEASLPRLYRIVTLRRAGIGLAAIADIVSDEKPEADALAAHLHELREERARLDALITAITEQFSALTGAMPQSDGADPVREHQRESAAFAQRLGDDCGAEAGEALERVSEGTLTASDLEHLAASGTVLLTRLAALVQGGIAPDSPRASAAVAEYRAAVGQHAPLSPEAEGALGELLIRDPLQRTILERIDPDLPAWLAAALDAQAGRET